jgi:hypothetical protein
VAIPATYIQTSTLTTPGGIAFSGMPVAVSFVDTPVVGQEITYESFARLTFELTSGAPRVQNNVLNVFEVKR